MTYSVQVPNAGESPGAFPAQNNDNFQVLYDLINNDHIFANTPPLAPNNNGGTHRQVTFTNLAATPTSLKGANAVLYSKLVSGASQLFMWNGATDQQISPVAISAVGQASLPQNGTLTSQIFSATYDFVGFGVAYINNTTDFTSYAFMRSGNNIASATLSSVSNVPRLVFASTGILPNPATISIANYSAVPGSLNINGAVYIIRL